jgi:putative alpha-1,2-mannosidase
MAAVGDAFKGQQDSSGEWFDPVDFVTQQDPVGGFDEKVAAGTEDLAALSVTMDLAGPMQSMGADDFCNWNGSADLLDTTRESPAPCVF